MILWSQPQVVLILEQAHQWTNPLELQMISNADDHIRCIEFVPQFLEFQFQCFLLFLSQVMAQELFAPLEQQLKLQKSFQQSSLFWIMVH